jgi:hypothetical protein
MDTTQLSPELHAPRPGAVPALMLVGAGFAVLAASAYTSGWMSEFNLCLSLIFVAAMLSIGAIARSAKEPSVEDTIQPGSPRLWLALGGLILVHCVIALYVERTTSGNIIDCFTFQRDALGSLMHGTDPYGGTQANIYSPAQASMFYGPGMVLDGRVQVGFQYPPITLLWAIPGYLLGDIRYSYVLALIFSSLLCFAIYPNNRGFCLAAFLLLDPVAFYVESRCWTEPLVFMALCATLYGSIKKRRWLPIAAGLFLATKQYNFLALPFMGFLLSPFRWQSYLKLLGVSLAVAAATVLPFAVWNTRAIWHDLVLFHLAQPFRADSLSFAVPFPVVLKIGPPLVLAFIAWAVWKGSRTAIMFVAGYATCLLLFFPTSKQAFSNYYLLIGESLLLAAAGFHRSSRSYPVEAAVEVGVSGMSY